MLQVIRSFAFNNFCKYVICYKFESAFALYVSFGVLMTSKLGTNEILMRYIAALVPLKFQRVDLR